MAFLAEAQISCVCSRCHHSVQCRIQHGSRHIYLLGCAVCARNHPHLRVHALVGTVQALPGVPQVCSKLLQGMRIALAHGNAVQASAEWCES